MKNKSQRHKDTNTFKFIPFSERISNIDVNVFHKVAHENAALNEETETFFYQTLTKWNVLNLTQGFESFQKNLRAYDFITLPQILLVKDHLVSLVLDEVKKGDPLYLQPILELLVALSRDLQKDFYPHFLQTLQILIEILDTKNTDQIDWAFNCLAFLFKYLWRCLAKNVKSILRALLPLLNDEKPDFINDFAAESFSFVARKVRNKETFLDIVLEFGQKEPESVSGLSKLLFRIIYGIDGRFHSCADSILPLYFDFLIDKKSIIIDNLIYLIIDNVKPEHGELFWSIIFKKINTYIQFDNQDQIDENSIQNLNILLKLLGQAVEYRNGFFLKDSSKVIDVIIDIINRIDKESINLSIIKIGIVIVSKKKIEHEKSAILMRKLIATRFEKNFLFLIDNVISIPEFDSIILPKFLNFFTKNRDSDTLKVLENIVLIKSPLEIELLKWKKYDLDFKLYNEEIIEFFLKNIESNKNSSIFLKCLPHLRIVDFDKISVLLKKRLLQQLKSINKNQNTKETILLIYDLLGCLARVEGQRQKTYAVEEKPTVKEKALISDPVMMTGDVSSAEEGLICVQKTISAEIPLKSPEDDVTIVVNNDLSVSSVEEEMLWDQKKVVEEVLNSLLIVKKVDESVSALKCMAFALEWLKNGGEERLTIPMLMKIHEKLEKQFGSPYSEVRLLTAKMYALFEDASTFQQANMGDIKIFSCIYEAQRLECDVVNFREKLRILERLSFDSLTYKSLCQCEGVFDTVPLRFLCGVLYENFQPLWDPVIKIITTHAYNNSSIFWSTFIDQLKSIPPSIAIIQSQSRPDTANYRLLLWKSMENFPRIAEAKTRDLSDLLLEFVSNEYKISTVQSFHTQNIKRFDTVPNENSEENVDDDKEEEVERKTKKSVLIKTLIQKLRVFSLFLSPLSSYREPELRKLYLDLLQHKNSQVQRTALDCLLTYKFDYIVQYKDALYNMVDDKNFMREIAVFKIDEDSETVKKEHRSELIPIILQIVFSKMTSKTGMRTGGKSSGRRRRDAILRFLSACRQNELLIFLRKALGLYEQFMVESPVIDLECFLSPKKLISSANLVEVVIDQCGGIIGDEIMEFLMKVLFVIGTYVKYAFTHITQIHPQYLPSLKTLRTTTTTLISKFFDDHNRYPLNNYQIDMIFSTFITPYLEKIPNDCISSPNALLKLILSWGYNPKFLSLLTYRHKMDNDQFPLLILMQLFQNQKLHPVVLNLLEDFLENLLNIQINENDDGITEDFSNFDPKSIIFPHVPSILKKIETKLCSKSKLNRKELSILCKLSEISESSSINRQILFSIIPSVVEKTMFSAEESLLSEYLTTISNLVKSIDFSWEISKKISPLFSRVNFPSCRKILCKIYQETAEKLPNDNDLKITSEIISGLNSFDKKWLDSPDYEKRDETFKKIDILLSNKKIPIDLGIILVYNFTHFIREKDLSLRENGSYFLKKVSIYLINTFPENVVYILDQSIFPLVQSELKSKDENTRNEFIRLLGELSRECFHSHYILEDLNRYSSKIDIEVDFFENLVHLQSHRRARALLRFSRITRDLYQSTIAVVESNHPQTENNFLQLSSEGSGDIPTKPEMKQLRTYPSIVETSTTESKFTPSESESQLVQSTTSSVKSSQVKTIYAQKVSKISLADSNVTETIVTNLNDTELLTESNIIPRASNVIQSKSRAIDSPPTEAKLLLNESKLVQPESKETQLRLTDLESSKRARINSNGCNFDPVDLKSCSIESTLLTTELKANPSDQPVTQIEPTIACAEFIHTKTLTRFVLPMLTYFLCEERFANKNALIDAATEAVGVASELLPWQQYEGLLRFYLGRLEGGGKKSEEGQYQKQLVKIVVTILDAFHFDLRNAVEASERQIHEREEENNGEDDLQEEREDDGVKKGVVKVLCKSTATRVVRILEIILVPKLLQSLAELTEFEKSHKINRKKLGREKEEEDLLRVPVSLAVVKLLQKLPVHILEKNLPGIFLKSCSFLRSRLESVRRSAKEILQKIMLALGPKYLSSLLSEMAPLMARGYQVHVLVFTVHGVLESLKQLFRPGDVDKILLTVVELCITDIFGPPSDQKLIHKITSKTPEARRSKSIPTLQLLARYVTRTALLDMILPFNRYLTTYSHKTTTRVHLSLQVIAVGLARNQFVAARDLAQFAFLAASGRLFLSAKHGTNSKTNEKVLINECPQLESGVAPGPNQSSQLTEGRGDCLLLKMGGSRGRKVQFSSGTNDHVAVEFGLRLFLELMKLERLTVEEEMEKYVDPFVGVLRQCLGSRSVKLITLTLQSLILVLKFDLPSLKLHIKSMTKEIFGTLHKFASEGLSKGDNFDLVMAAFKATACIIRHPQHIISSTQLKHLLFYIERDIHDQDRHASAFSLLQSILSRKMAGHSQELQPLMRSVAEMSIRSESERVRAQARSAFFRYVMDYPMAGGELEGHLSFLLAQLNYETSVGREAALEIILMFIDAFPIEVLKTHSGLLLVSLSARLANEDEPKCKKKIVDCIATMLKKLQKINRDALFDVVLAWMKDKNIHHRTLSAQLCGIFVSVEKTDFESRLDRLFPLLLQQFGIDNSPGKSVKIDSLVFDTRRDHLFFHNLQLLLKITANCPAFLSKQNVFAIQKVNVNNCKTSNNENMSENIQVYQNGYKSSDDRIISVSKRLSASDTIPSKKLRLSSHSDDDKKISFKKVATKKKVLASKKGSADGKLHISGRVSTNNLASAPEKLFSEIAGNERVSVSGQVVADNITSFTMESTDENVSRLNGLSAFDDAQTSSVFNGTSAHQGEQISMPEERVNVESSLKTVTVRESKLERLSVRIQELLAYPHDWVRLGAAQFLGYVLGNEDAVKLGKLVINEGVEEMGYLRNGTADKVKRLALDLCDQLEIKELRRELGEQVVKNLVFIAKVVQAVPPVSNKPNLLWLTKRMRKIVHTETINNPKSVVARTEVFKWIAGVTTTLEIENLLPVLHHLVAPLIRELSTNEEEKERTGHTPPLITLAKQVCEILKKKVGVSEYTRAAAHQQRVLEAKRAERKRYRAQSAVVDPEIHAAKKLKRNIKKKEAKKKKIERFKGIKR